MFARCGSDDDREAGREEEPDQVSAVQDAPELLVRVRGKRMWPLQPRWRCLSRCLTMALRIERIATAVRAATTMIAYGEPNQNVVRLVRWCTIEYDANQAGPF